MACNLSLCLFNCFLRSLERGQTGLRELKRQEASRQSRGEQTK